MNLKNFHIKVNTKNFYIKELKLGVHDRNKLTYGREVIKWPIQNKLTVLSRNHCKSTKELKPNPLKGVRGYITIHVDNVLSNKIKLTKTCCDIKKTPLSKCNFKHRGYHSSVIFWLYMIILHFYSLLI